MRQGSFVVRLARLTIPAPLVIAAGACTHLGRQQLYQPQPIAVATPAWAERAPRAVSVTTSDGLVLKGWYWPPARSDGAVLVYFHGRAGNRDVAAAGAQAFSQGGRGLLVASYRGFGDNPGTPSQEGLFADGAAWVGLARTLAPDAKVFLFGEGIGASVALDEAARAPVTGVVTLGAFARLRDFAPAITRGLYSDEYDNLALIAKVRCTVLIMHGLKDEVVPFAEAEKLRAAAGGPALVVPIEGEALHRFDLGYIAPIVWRALDQIGKEGAASSAR